MKSMPTLNRYQRGLSIIELMIALLLGSLLTVGMVQIFTSNSQAFQMSEAIARSQEYGRIASEMLSREVRGAGYYGCNGQSVANNLAVEEGDANWDLYDYAGGPAVSSLDQWRPAAAIDGTDILHFSGMESSGIEIYTDEPPTAASTRVSSRSGRGPASELSNDDIIAITDCQGTDVVQISNIQGDGEDLEVTLVTNSGGGSQVPGNDFSDNVCSNTGSAGAGNNCLSNDYGIGAQILKPYKRTYFIGPSNVRGGEPALKMVEYKGASSRTFEVVEGVIDLQVRYGLSSDPDQAVSSWKEADNMQTSDWDLVRSARVSLLVRGGPDNLFDDKATVCFPAWTDCSAGDNYTATDNSMYRVYSFTTNVRNKSS
jgi:type IV pilus assembly protein PilW